MPEATKLQAQTTAEDSALIEVGINNSLFKKRPHRCTTDYALQEKRLQFINPTVATGQEVYFEIDKEGTLLRDITFCFTAPALAGVVTGAPTYARYGDFGGLQCIDRNIPISYDYGASNVHRVYPDQVYSQYFFENNEGREYCEDLLVGERTSAERNTLALAPQEFRVPLPHPWEGCGNEIPICALANKLKIRLTMASAAAAIQTDGVKPASFNYTNCYLRYELVHVPGADREALAASTFTPDGRFTLFTDVTRKEIVIPANAMFSNTPTQYGFNIDLRDITGAVRNIKGMLRTSTQLDATQQAPAPYELDTSYLNNLTFQVRANDRVLFEETRPNFEQVEQLKRLYDCAPDIGQFHIFWDADPNNTHFASGHISLANFSSATLYLRSTVAHPELRLSMLAYRWNWTNQKNGNYQRIWN
jgi:hypothetical protein